MEISSSASNGKRLSNSQPQFSFQSDSQPETPFELLLALPTTSVATPQGQEVESPEITYESCGPSCEDAVEERSESEITEDKEQDEDDAALDTTVGVAVLDVVASQQLQHVEQPVEQPIEQHHEKVVTEGVADAELPEVAITADNTTNEVVRLEDHAGLPVSPKNEDSPELRDAEASGLEAKDSAQSPQNVVKPQGKKQDSDGDRPSRQRTDLGTQKPDANNLEKATLVQPSEQPKVQPGPEETSADIDRPLRSQPESTRKGEQRERPARWYEKESSGKSSDVEPSNQGLNEVLEAGLNDSTDQISDGNTLSTSEASSQQNSLQQEVLAEASSSGVAELGINDISSLESASATSVGLNSPNGVSVDSTGRASAEDLRPVLSGSERVQAKSIAGSESKIESAQTGPQVDVSRAEKVRLVQRVARSFSRIGPTGGSVQIKLHPPELGALAVQVRIEGRSMSARLTTESQAAREVIMESLPQLRSRLAEQGYDVVQFTVDVASDSSSLGSESGAGQGAGQEAAGQGGFAGNSADNQGRSSSLTELRRSAFLRRQIDVGNGPQQSSVRWTGTGVDIQA